MRAADFKLRLDARMRSFESFRAKREKMDPSSANLTESQWQQAYAAYRQSRERVQSRSMKGDPSARSSSQTDRPVGGMHFPSTVSATAVLRKKIRENSAYADLRTIVDLIAWGMMGLVVLIAVFKILLFAAETDALVLIASCVLHVLLLVVGRFLIHVLIDIPDVGLYRITQESAHHAERGAAQGSDVGM